MHGCCWLYCWAATISAGAAAAAAAAARSVVLSSGSLSFLVGQNGTYSLTVGGEPPVRGAPIAIFAEGAWRTVANGGLRCGSTPAAPLIGSDTFGRYEAVEVVCEVGPGAAVAHFSWRAYAGRTPAQGKLMASLRLPGGANGTAAQGAFNVHNTAPVQFAPFPAWRVEGAFNSSAFLCYGGDKSHLYSSHASSAGGGGMSTVSESCFHLGNGPATMLWPRPAHSPRGSTHALVSGPADSFHLNYNRLQTGATPQGSEVLTAKLWYNAVRGDAVLCLSAGCDKTQANSGYTILSANEGTVNPASMPPPGMPGGKGLGVPLCFSWSQKNLDNWVTNNTKCPGPSYKNCGNANGLIYCCAGKGRIPLETFSNSNGTHHVAVATTQSKAWAVAHGYSSTGILGYLDSPPPAVDLCASHSGTDYVCCDLKQINVSSPAECCQACKNVEGGICTAWKTTRNGGQCYLKTGTLSNPVKVSDQVVVGYAHAPKPAPKPADSSLWTFGVSGDVVSVPAGFTQSTLLVHSQLGSNDAWDEWGATLRAAYNTQKLADEDVFLAALTMWTDNGAATLGAAWKSSPGTRPPVVAPGPVGPDAHDLGPNIGYMNWNWSMVSTEVLGAVADSVKATGIAPRATQLDCWWYPVQTGGRGPGSKHPDWCVSDWVLPKTFYPNGQGGLRKRQGVPQMMYFPNLCADNAWNALNRYTWSATADESGFVLPIANQSKQFWSDMFDYGSMLASKSVDPKSLPWPGLWAPPAVVAGWQGTNLAAYETDFYHNIVSLVPELRQSFGAGEMFLGGIDAACASHNMTAQLCAGNPPSFLEALTMPRITNARASIDYDWDGDPTANTGPRSNNGAHNWAAADNGWVFWATRMAPSKDNFWTSFRDLHLDGGSQDSGRNGKDAQLHAIAALLSTGPVGLGDTCVGSECMVNATLVRRLARADGVLLRPDRPLAPMDVMFGSLVGSNARSMPGLCTPAQERGGHAENMPCGARLWQTHASVFPENRNKAPELATAATRRLVSHAGIDATDQKTIPAALAKSQFLLQHIVVSVDQAASFLLQDLDFYPRLSNQSDVFWRLATDGGKNCTVGVDAVASGCVHLAPNVVPTTPLFDISTVDSKCSQPPYSGGFLPAGPNCLHSVNIWQVWHAATSSKFVLLGDLTKYVPLSGYRFRLPDPQKVSSSVGEELIVVGLPGEEVEITYLRKESAAWIVQMAKVAIGPNGRTQIRLV